MECNKDEATRVKEVAEKKFIAKDVMGAKKFALKAQKMYPELEGIPRLIATLDVHLCAKNKIDGQPDWYGILGVNPQLSDDQTLREQYKKQALMIHPDKNKSVGADEAFKLVREAWSLLSDKGRRLAYDSKTNGKAMHTASSTPKTTTSSSANTSESNPPAAACRSSKSADQSSNPASSHEPKSDTFTTLCHSCRTWNQYSIVYLDHSLLCLKCGERFFAIEVLPPITTDPKNFWKQWHDANEKVRRREAEEATKTEEAMGSKHHASKRASDDCSNEYVNTAKKSRGM